MKKQRFTNKTITGLDLKQKLVVVQMLCQLLTHERDDNGRLQIVGVAADSLRTSLMTTEQAAKHCERLVELGIFLRQSGDDVSHGENAPVSNDNWYSFNHNFVDWLESDQKRYDLLGAQICSTFRVLSPKMQVMLFAECATGILQRTYL